MIRTEVIWYDVSEKMPENDRVVFLMDAYGDCTVGRHWKDCGYFVDACELGQLVGIRFWAEIPDLQGDRALSAVLQSAEKIAREAHAGQKEESTGDDYIRHIERVVTLVENDEEEIVAWLHDVLEDTSVEREDLYRWGIPRKYLQAVAILTRHKSESYGYYIDLIKESGNPLALAVKKADLKDHLRPSCPARLRARYIAACEVLGVEVPSGFVSDGQRYLGDAS